LFLRSGALDARGAFISLLQMAKTMAGLERKEAKKASIHFCHDRILFGGVSCSFSDAGRLNVAEL